MALVDRDTSDRDFSAQKIATLVSLHGNAGEMHSFPAGLELFRDAAANPGAVLPVYAGARNAD